MDANNDGKKQLCYFVIQFTDDHGAISLGDMDQEDKTLITFSDRYETDYNEKGDYCETIYLISFYPQNQDNFFVNFWVEYMIIR